MKTRTNKIMQCINKSTQLETYVIWWRGDSGFGHASITRRTLPTQSYEKVNRTINYDPIKTNARNNKRNEIRKVTRTMKHIIFMI